MICPTKISLLIALAIALMSGIARAENPAELLTTPSVEQLSRQLIVFYPDRSIGRSVLGSADPDYGRDLDYRGSSWSIRISSRLARDYHLQKVAEWPINRLGVHCVVYQINEARDLEQVLYLLARDTRVGTVQRMHIFHVLAGDPYFALQSALKALEIGPAHRYATGRGVTIGIIDTGVDLEHPALQSQILRHLDLVGDASSFNAEIHGTAVAGIIAAAADNSQGIVGVAPDAKLVVLRACWAERAGQIAAVCSSLTLARALDAALEAGINVLNLSLAGPPDPLLALSLKSVLDAHVIVIAAEPDAAATSDLFPSTVAGVIRARATTGTEVAENLSAHKVVLAPGIEVLTTFPNAAYHYVSGNSFAAAHVSGVAALLLQLQPELSAATLENLLLGSQQRQGSVAAELGSIDACEAIRKLNLTANCALRDENIGENRNSRSVSSPNSAMEHPLLAPSLPVKFTRSHAG